MNVTLCFTRNYENNPALPLRQNKPNQTQFKPNFPKGKMSATSLLTKDYENKSNWTLGENKPKTNPIKANFKKNECQLLCYTAEADKIALQIYPFGIHCPIVLKETLSAFTGSENGRIQD